MAENQIRAETAEEMERLLAAGLSDRELFLIGLMLYWAEGGKTHQHLTLTNSDPVVVQTFVLWLRQCLSIGREQLRAEVHGYPDVDVDEAENYWCGIIGIDRTQLYKFQIDHRANKTVEKRGKLRYGTVHVKVLGKGTSNVHRRIMGWIAGLGRYVETAVRE